jgi:hypothetical protein
MTFRKADPFTIEQARRGGRKTGPKGFAVSGMQKEMGRKGGLTKRRQHENHQSNGSAIGDSTQQAQENPNSST